MKKFTHIFFDLDHTLWDYDFNARKVLTDLYFQYELDQRLASSVEGFIGAFFKVNAQLWRYYNAGEITRDDIRARRFREVIKMCGCQDVEVGDVLTEFFLFNCPRQTRIMPDADLILDYLHKRYELSVITNGFDEVQALKLQSCGLDKYFSYVFTSETTGHRKPAAELFLHALEVTKADRSTTLMIGDNPVTDIQGALNAGITPLFYNPKGKYKSACELQVTNLAELLKIL